MGVIQSKHPRAWQQLRKCASAFGKGEVGRARDRFAEAYAESGSFLVGRREFFEVFTDLDIRFVQQGQFLSLPLELFPVFEVEAGSGVVDIREVFSLLSLLSSRGTTYGKLELLFPLFGPCMTEERVAQLLACVQRALGRFEMWEWREPPQQILALAAKICGEGAFRKCKTVSASLLGDWLLNSPELAEVTALFCSESSRTSAQQFSLIRKQEEVRSHLALMKREAKKLLAEVTAHTASEPALGSGSAGKARSTRSSLVPPPPEGAAKGAARGKHKDSVTSQGSPSSPGSPGSPGSPVGSLDLSRRGSVRGGESSSGRQDANSSGRQDANSSRRQDGSGRRDSSGSARRLSVGRSSGKFAALGSGRAVELNERTIYGMGYEDLRVLRALWEQRSTKKGLARERFPEVICAKFGQVCNPSAIPRMFDVFDRNKDGLLDYPTFLVGAARLADSSLEDKIKFVFMAASVNMPLADVRARLESEAAAAEGGKKEGGKEGNGKDGHGKDGLGKVTQQKPVAGGRSESGTVVPRTHRANAEGLELPIGTARSGADSSRALPSASSEVPLSAGGSSRAPGEPALRMHDLAKLVQDYNNEMNECAAFVEVIITTMDYDKNGVVDADEFERAVVEMPSVLSSFDECLAPSHDLVLQARQIASTDASFTADAVIESWISLRTEREQFKRVAWDGFVEFFDKVMGRGSFALREIQDRRGHMVAERPFNPLAMERSPTPDSSLPHGDQVYNALVCLFRVAAGADARYALPSPQPQQQQQQADSECTVDFRKLLAGVVLALDSTDALGGTHRIQRPLTLARKGQFYFELFDVDASGEVEYFEFFEMLYASQLDIEDAGWRSVETLRSIEERSATAAAGQRGHLQQSSISPVRERSPGVITLSEFLKEMDEHDCLRECFGRLTRSSVARAREAGDPHTGLSTQAAAGEDTSDSDGDDDERDIFSPNGEEVAERYVDGLIDSFGVSTALEPIVDMSPPGSPTNKDAPLLRPSMTAPVLPLGVKYKTSYFFYGKEGKAKLSASSSHISLGDPTEVPVSIGASPGGNAIPVDPQAEAAPGAMTVSPSKRSSLVASQSQSRLMQAGGKRPSRLEPLGITDRRSSATATSNTT
jgi:Ca2+-binding EF-hand superfamily protein